MRGILFVLASLCVAAPASADPVKLAGGPADSEATIAALEKARGLMTVCWQRKPPAKVKIALAVAASGEVTKATAKTKGPAAQCAAGILAVATLAPAAKAWKGTAELETVAEGKAQDVRAIHDQLAAAGSDFFACQKQAPRFAGKVTLRVTVAEDGTVVDAEGIVPDKAGVRVAGCVAGVAQAMTLRPISSPSVTYELGLTFQGGEGKGTAASDDDTDASLRPSLKGPLEATEVAEVIAARRADLKKCARRAKARGKVVVRIAIGADGKVAKAKIKSSELGDAKIEACLVGVFAKLSFRKSSSETVVHYPMRIDDDGLKTAP